MFSHLLVPLDGSALAERILPVACAMAEQCGARLTLLHVLEKHARPTIHLQPHLTDPEQAESYLQEAAGHLSCGPRIEHHVHTDRVGHVGPSIVQHAAEIGADLIAMTTHGAGGVKRVLFGSIAQQVMGQSGVPVLLITTSYDPGRGTGAIRKLLLPVDLDPAHDPATHLALELARRVGANVTCVGVAATAADLTGNRSAAAQLQPFATAALLAAEREQLTARLSAISQSAADQSVPIETILDSGPPAARILGEIDRRKPDLVLFASHRRRGLDAAITGSTGQQLCNRSTSPLLIVPV